MYDTSQKDKLYFKYENYPSLDQYLSTDFSFALLDESVKEVKKTVTVTLLGMPADRDRTFEVRGPFTTPPRITPRRRTARADRRHRERRLHDRQAHRPGRLRGGADRRDAEAHGEDYDENRVAGAPDRPERRVRRRAPERLPVPDLGRNRRLPLLAWHLPATQQWY